MVLRWSLADATGADDTYLGLLPSGRSVAELTRVRGEAWRVIVYLTGPSVAQQIGSREACQAYASRLVAQDQA